MTWLRNFVARTNLFAFDDNDISSYDKHPPLEPARPSPPTPRGCLSLTPQALDRLTNKSKAHSDATQRNARRQHRRLDSNISSEHNTRTSFFPAFGPPFSLSYREHCLHSIPISTPSSARGLFAFTRRHAGRGFVR